MATLDNFRDSLKEKSAEAWQQIQDSSAFQQLKERFDSMSTLAQKSVIFGASFFVVLCLLLAPYSWWTESNDALTEFESTKAQIRELFRVTRQAKAVVTSASVLPGNVLIPRVAGLLTAAQLKPEQIKSPAKEYDHSAVNDSQIPKAIQQKGFEVTMAKMNLAQIVDVGSKLQNLDPNVRMVSLNIESDVEDGRYFDVTYKLVTFTLPERPMSKGNGSNSKKSKTRSNSENDSGGDS